MRLAPNKRLGIVDIHVTGSTELVIKPQSVLCTVYSAGKVYIQVPLETIPVHGSRIDPDASTHRLDTEVSIPLLVDNDRFHARMQQVGPLLICMLLTDKHALHTWTSVADNTCESG